MDIDFGGDDFFNSFQPAAAVEPDQPLFGGFGGSQNNVVQKKTTTSNKLKEIDSDPFKLGSSAAGSSSLSSNPLAGSENALSDQ